MSLMLEDDGDTLIVSLIQLSRSLKFVLSYPALFVNEACSAHSSDYVVIREALKVVRSLEETLYSDSPPKT